MKTRCTRVSVEKSVSELSGLSGGQETSFKELEIAM